MEVRITCEGAGKIRLDQIEEFQGNLKELHEEEYLKLKRSILKFGFSFPFYIWKHADKFFCFDGHQRKRTLIRMGNENIHLPHEFPCDWIHAKDYEEAKRKVLAATSQIGRMTGEGLYEFLHDSKIDFQEIKEDFRFPEIDFKKFENEFIEEGIVEGEDDAPPVRSDTSIKRGDLFTLGNHRLMCGDATNHADVELLMNGEKADMVYTDPPYLPSNTRYGFDGFNGRNRQSIKNCETDELAIKCYEAIPLVDEMYVWSDFMSASILNFKPRDAIVWKKNNFGLGRGYRNQHEVCFYIGNFQGSDSDVWEIPKDFQTDHPTQKPVALAERAIKNSNPAIVLDLFLGSGSTLIACEKTNRRCFGSEIDPTYCDVIIRRWEKFSGQTAYLIEDANGKLPNGPVPFAELSSLRSEILTGESKNTVQKPAGISEEIIVRKNAKRAAKKA